MALLFWQHYCGVSFSREINMVRQLMFFLMIFLFFSCATTNVMKNSETKEVLTSKTRLIKVNEIGDIVDNQALKNSTIIIFSSRDYILTFATIIKGGLKEIYWVIPDDEIKPEDVMTYESFLKEAKVNYDIKFSAEGLTGNINGIPLTIIPKTRISVIVTEEPVVIADVDFFFRVNRNKITQPKALDVLTFYRTLDEYKIYPSLFVILRSLDINLPDWVQEFTYLLEGIFPYWQKKEVPYSFLALDEAERLITFAQYEEAYQILKEIEKEQEKNPYYYEKLFWTSMKTYRDNELLMAADRAYRLDASMIVLYLDGTDYLLSKNEIYPAFVLIRKALEKEPWNKKIRTKFEEVVEYGYNYYNQHGETELFELFKKEREKLQK